MAAGPDADEPGWWCASRPRASPATSSPTSPGARRARRGGGPRRPAPLATPSPRTAPRCSAAHGIPVTLGRAPAAHPGRGVRDPPPGLRRGDRASPPATTRRADNGLKLYLGDGAQIVPPVDGQVAAAIDGGRRRRRGDPRGRRAGAGRAARPRGGRRLPGARPSRGCRPRPPPSGSPRRRCTASAGPLLAGLLAAAGHARRASGRRRRRRPTRTSRPSPSPTRRSRAPPTCWPRTMRDVGADLGLALDPDADRVAVLVPDRGRTAPPADRRRRRRAARRLAAGLGDLRARTGWWCRAWSPRPCSRAIAEARGARHAETLTGFKWLSRPAMEHPELVQVLAYEEAIGYAIGPEVRDKDGLSAARGGGVDGRGGRRARGRTLLDELDDLHRRHGAHVTDNFSLRDEAPGGAARRAALVERLVRRARRRGIGGERVDRRAQPGARRAAHRPRGRGPGGGAPERHRAQAQVLLRGGRAGGDGDVEAARGAGAGAPRAASARAWPHCSSPDAARGACQDRRMLTLGRDARGAVLSGAALDRPAAGGRRRRPRAGAARRPAGRPLDQAREQAGGPGAGRALHRPHHARGRRHPGQGAGALRPRAAPRSRRPVARAGGRGLRLRLAGGRGPRGAGGHDRAGGLGRRGASPPGRATWTQRLEEIRRAVDDGADEIDIVLNRGALLAGRLRRGARRGGRLQGGLRATPT